MRSILLFIFIVIFCGCSTGNPPPQPPVHQTPVEKLYPEWIRLKNGTMPPARYRHCMAYDSDKKVVLLFGGRSDESANSNDTWMYDGADWTKLNPVVAPSPRHDMKMVYDVDRHIFVMTGGFVIGPEPPDLETWEFNYTTWQEVTTTNKPPNRGSAAMVYHPLEKCTYLFGGSYSGENYVYWNDLWRYDGVDWSQVETEHKPSGRRRCEMVYDSARNCLVLFGGDTVTKTFNDTWEFDGKDWALITTRKKPSKRGYYGFAYDKSVSLTILFGGDKMVVRYNDTWAYDGHNWRKLTTEISPGRRASVMVYNESMEGCFLFSGRNAGSTMNFEDHWLFRYTSDPQNDDEQ